MFAAASNGLLPVDKSKIRGMFVFGSSVVDNGNNNFIPNPLGRADYPPYGVDFPLGSTGRFTNGENMADILGKKLNISNYIPPFNDPSTAGTRIVHGVNYGSGGSGVLDETGANLSFIQGNVVSLNRQISNFEAMTLPKLEMQLGQNRSRLLPQYLFFVACGGNDYSLNYFLNSTRSNVTLEAFTANLISTYTLGLKRLYSLGARKFVLASIVPNGCAPVAVALAPGFLNVNTSCCKVSASASRIGCARGGSVCTNRREFVYFDHTHVTEAVNHEIATKAVSSNLRDEVYPYNVQKLSQI
ncbi:GDSL esterase/lipase At1g29670-like isoform X3 [Andrographis paniculata]|uniref:GDSL esterase/lipase At1g29670-like isoform X3 n=1 Tax=Andrographis paniculata TaxID=175694 RepID=UPI0021E82F4C|nr:GDSL esterase/lipase At1g29670-like isoform X3 [Andrographis paniculata]